MKHTHRSFFAVLTAVALAVAFCLGLASCGGTTNYAAHNTEFVIGASGPLTGGAANYGKAVENGANLAVSEINAAGGIGGVRLKFIMMDDKHDASNVSTNYTAMFEAGMQLSLGCVTTIPCKEFKTLSHEDNLFFLTPSASADTIVEYDNAYQMCFADNNQGTVAARYVNRLYDGVSKTIGVLYRSDDPYSTGIYARFRENLDANITVVETSFTGDTVPSFASQIHQLKNTDFIFLPIYSAPAAQFMTEARHEIPQDAVYYGCDGLDGIDTSVENFDISTIPQEISFLSHFNSHATDGAAGTFIDKYTATYGTSTLNQFAASAYDAVYALAGALSQAGDRITVTSSPSEICEVMKDVFTDGYTFDGVTGTGITWDASGFVNKQAVKYIVKPKNSENP